MVTITRHAAGAQVLAKWLHSDYPINTLYPGLLPETIENLTRASIMHKAAVWEDIERLWGPSDGMVMGKYQKARAFVFLYGQETIMCIAELGGRGTSWEWVRPEGSNPTWRPMTIESTEAAHFWPAFCQDFIAQVRDAAPAPGDSGPCS